MVQRQSAKINRGSCLGDSQARLNNTVQGRNSHATATAEIALAPFQVVGGYIITQLLETLPSLSPDQFNIVDNMLSMAVATMGAAALFFFLARSSVASKYRPALLVSGLVVSIACYHYFMIRLSWNGAFTNMGMPTKHREKLATLLTHNFQTWDNVSLLNA